MKRIATLGALAGVLSLLVFHQAMWAVIWVWSSGSFPRPYHIIPYWRVEFLDVILLYIWGAFWGAVAAYFIERWPRRNPLETGLCVGAALMLVHPLIVQVFILHPLMGGGPLSPRILDNILLPAVFPYLAINMAWGIGVGLIYPRLVRRFGESEA